MASERWFADLLTSPHWIELIGILVAVEGLLVIRWRGLPPMATVRMLLPALCLLAGAALRAGGAGVAVGAAGADRRTCGASVGPVGAVAAVETEPFASVTGRREGNT